MAFNIRKFLEGLKIIPKSVSTINEAGEMEVLSSDSNKLQYHNGTNKSPVVTEAHSATLTNKTIDGDNNTIQDVGISSLKTVLADANKVVRRDASGAVVSDNAVPNSSQLVTLDSSDTLSNKTIDTASSNTLKVNGNQLSASAGTATLTLPNSTDTLVGRATTDTLTNKTLSDSTTVIADASDATKQIKFDAAGTSGTSTTLTGSQTVNRTLTLPDATDTLVGKATSDTLTNKTLSDSTTVIADVSDPTKQIKFDAAGTSGTSTTLAGSQTVNRTLTLPDATDTLVGKATSDTFTNKTFDAQGTGNSLTNITDTNIKTGAAINRAKLASGSANHVIINDGSGVLSSEAALAISRGGTGQATKTAAFDALSPTTTAGDVIVFNGTNNVRQPIGSDGQVLVVDNGQTNKLKWTTLQQGAKNYITYGTFENNDANTGWSLSHSTLDSTTKLPNQASGSWTAAAGTLSKSIVSSGQLAGSYSLSLASSAATTAGDMLVTSVLTLDLEAQSSVQTFSFFYKVASGATNGNFSGTSSNSVGVAIYVVDGTLGGTWIQPAGVFNVVQSSGVGKASGTFQVPSDATQVRLAVYFPNATTGAITLYLDDFVLGPQVVQYGAPVTDWIDAGTTTYNGAGVKTATGLLDGGWTTNTTYTGRYRRVGDSLEVTGKVLLAGAPNSATLTITLPSGLSIDTTKLGSTTGGANDIGVGTCEDSGIRNYQKFTVDYNGSATSVRLVANAVSGTYFAGGPVTQAVPFTWGASDNLYFRFQVPILGWSSTVQMSNDTDTRVVAARVSTSSTQLCTEAAETTINYTAEYDTHNAYNGTSYVVPVSGYYRISGSVIFNISFASGSVIEIVALKGSTGYSLNRTILSSGNVASTSGSGTIYANAGETIQFRIYQSSGANRNLLSSTRYNWFSIERLSGPSAIAATETVAASYKTSSAQTIAAFPTEPTIIYGTKVYDTHGFYNPNTGVGTIPVSGKYRFSASAFLANQSLVAGSSIDLSLFIASTKVRTFYRYQPGTSVTLLPCVAGSFSYDCLAGQSFEIKIVTTGSATTLQPDPNINYFSVERVGN